MPKITVMDCRHGCCVVWWAASGEFHEIFDNLHFGQHPVLLVISFGVKFQATHVQDPSQLSKCRCKICMGYGAVIHAFHNRSDCRCYVTGSCYLSEGKPLRLCLVAPMLVSCSIEICPHQWASARRRLDLGSSNRRSNLDTMKRAKYTLTTGVTNLRAWR